MTMMNDDMPKIWHNVWYTNRPSSQCFQRMCEDELAQLSYHHMALKHNHTDANPKSKKFIFVNCQITEQVCMHLN